MIHIWIAFNVFVLAMLALDLGVFHRKNREISVSQALKWSAFWIGLALAFNVGIFVWRGPEVGLEFLTGYLVEKSLSIDNIFVFWMIFTCFGVPPKYQYRVLFWGIVGALAMRAAFIFTGLTLLKHLHEIIYVFGAFLIITGVRMALHRNTEVHLERNPVLKLACRWLPVTEQLDGGRFFTRTGGILMATPLFLVLLVVETTDLVFAVDSIPAILAITQDSFIVYTSNVFAILGLRALYFALSGLVQQFRFLHVGLAVILAFVGMKMIMTDFYKIPIHTALGVIGGVLTASVATSLLFPAPVPSCGTVTKSTDLCPDELLDD